MDILDLDSLLEYIDSIKVDAIVVEGYDGVGKGKLLNIISSRLGVTPYRPDYNLWQKYDHRKIDRWKISGFFWDVFSHFDIHLEKPMLFDRGVISGAVYNKDDMIADDYRTILRYSKVLHILVVCDYEDYAKFQIMRNPEVEKSEILSEFRKYKIYTDSYINSFRRSGVDFIVYQNQFDENNQGSENCISCGHYNYGFCRHPKRNCEVNPSDRRCNLSKDKEVQDNDAEMHCV